MSSPRPVVGAGEDVGATACPQPYDLMVCFAAYTGLRTGEIAALRRRHLRLDDTKVVVLTALRGA